MSTYCFSSLKGKWLILPFIRPNVNANSGSSLNFQDEVEIQSTVLARARRLPRWGAAASGHYPKIHGRPQLMPNNASAPEARKQVSPPLEPSACEGGRVGKRKKQTSPGGAAQ